MDKDVASQPLKTTECILRSQTTDYKDDNTRKDQLVLLPETSFIGIKDTYKPWESKLVISLCVEKEY